MLDFESETSVQAFAVEEEPHDYVFWVAGAFLKKAPAAVIFDDAHVAERHGEAGG